MEQQVDGLFCHYAIHISCLVSLTTSKFDVIMGIIVENLWLTFTYIRYRTLRGVVMQWQWDVEREIYMQKETAVGTAICKGELFWFRRINLLFVITIS